MVRGIIGLVVLCGAQMVQGAILLGTSNVQTPYAISDDTNTVGIEIECDMTWYNNSANVPANNQISANGTFGSTNSGLVEITTDEFPHNILTPTYYIITNSFNNDYADGVVNTPNDSDTFVFHFNLGTTNGAVAQAAVDELNACVAGSLEGHDSLYVLQAAINGEVAGNAWPVPFENSPVVYVPWRAGMERDAHGVWPGWYRQHGTSAEADPDNDRYLSWQESICGTDPTNGLDFLHFSISSNALHVSTVSNRNYAVRTGGQPGDLSLPLTNFPGTGTPVEIPIGQTTASAFFRVEASLPDL